jgi:caa(3)-type oxidase subunit IV
MTEQEFRRHTMRLLATLAALLVLTLASWGLAQITGEVTGPIVAFGIAIAKSLLVLFVFMELTEGGTTSWVAGVVAIAFIGLLVAGAVVDVATR